LLFTINQRDVEKIRLVQGISIIGHIVPKSEGQKLITPDGLSIDLTAQGWDAMRKRVS